MLHEHLRTLAADVGRLLAAGAAAAPGDEGLRRRAKAIRERSAKVPALSAVAGAVERLARRGEEPAPALLDLLLVLRRVQGGLAQSDTAGPPALERIAPSGPWASDTPIALLSEIAEALTGKGADRAPVVRHAVAEHATADLRLAEPLLRALADRNDELAALVAEQALPAFGPGLLPELARAPDLAGGAAEGRRLAALARLDAARAIPLLLAACEGKGALRTLAEKALASIGEPAVAPLTGALTGAGKVRRSAAEALRQLGPPARAAAPALIAALADRDKHLRRAALGALRAIRPWKARDAVGLLTASLEDPDGDVRLEAAGALGDLGPGAPDAVPALLGAVRERRLEPFQAAKALGAIARKDAPAEAQVIEAARRDETPVRVAALHALMRSGASDPTAVVVVCEALGDPEEEIRRMAAAVLSELGPAPEALGVLLKTLEDPDMRVRTSAVRALGKLGPAAPEVVPALTARVWDGMSAVRCEAVDALVRMGPAAHPALPALLGALRAPDPQVRHKVWDGLPALRAPAPLVLPAVVEALQGKAVYDRLRAADYLGHLGAAAKGAVPALLEALGDASAPGVQERAALSLQAIGADAEALRPRLVAALASPSQPLRVTAAKLLGNLGPAGRAAVPVLVEALQDSSNPVRAAAAAALLRLGAEEARALDTLAGLLGDRQHWTRSQAVGAVGELGPAGRPARGLLAKMGADANAHVRGLVAWALHRIDQEPSP
jgi:HEAT repeat protein